MKKAAALALAAGFVFALLACLPPEAAAQGDFNLTATASPVEVTVGQPVSLEINLTNLRNQTYKPVILIVYVYPSSSSVADAEAISPNMVIPELGPNRSVNVTVRFSPKIAEGHSLTVKVFSPDTTSANLKDIHDISPVFLAKPKEASQNGGLPLMMILGVVAALAVVVVLVLVMRARKRPVPEPEPGPAAGPAAGEPEEPKVEGKFPKDYYKFRREKFSRLKPVGLTRSGNTILGNIKKQDDQDSVLDAPVQVTTCPRCGIGMERNWKTCHNCGAKDTIQKARDAIGRMEKHGLKVQSLQDMLQGAESSLEARNYDEAETYAHDVVDRARAQLRHHEESQPAPEGPPSYAADESATREGAAPVASPAAAADRPAAGYSGQTEGARGYQEVTVTKEYSDTRKPEKKEPNACWKCGQGLRPEWKKCPYCNVPQEGICRSCGRGVKLRWHNCPHCKADLSVEKPGLACPVCGAELPAEGECQSCRALALKDTTARLVKEVKAKGADVIEAESLVGRGELALKIKNYEKAVSHFQAAELLAKKARKDYRTRRLKERLESTETVLRDASAAGTEVAPARAALSGARTALDEDRIDEGLALVEKANNLVAEAMEKATAKPATPIEVLVKKPAVVADVKVKPRCPHCQEQIEENLDRCPFCLSNLRGRCPRCGAVVKPEWKICPACEAALK